MCEKVLSKMNEKNCRLCLDTVNDNFQMLDVSRDILGKLPLNLNLDISKEAVICYECTNNLQVLSNFKSINPKNCSHRPHGEEFNSTNADSVGSSEQQKKCCFCTNTTEKEILSSLNESKENMFLMDMIRKHISEWNISNTEELLTCHNCIESLQRVFKFITNSLAVEEKIKRYIEIEGADVNGQIELSAVRQFELKPLAKYEASCSDFIKMEDTDERGEYTTVKPEPGIENEGIDNSDLDIKPEELDVLLKQDDYEGFQDISMEISMNNGEIASLRCEMCIFITDCKIALEKHILTHGIPSVLMYRCEMCSYKTEHKKYLTRHMLVHKNPSEMTMYKCKICKYETKQKRYLRRHMLVHKNPSDVKMYKCEMCTFETKHQPYINTHMSTHKNPSEIKMFKCEICTHETRRKSHLDRHMLTHKDRSEVVMYKCEKCTYETKHKNCITDHVLRHENLPKLITFKCDSCTYETRFKGTLRRHLLSHKSPLEVTMHKCEMCTFQSKYRGALTRHVMIHKISKIPVSQKKTEISRGKTKT